VHFELVHGRRWLSTALLLLFFQLVHCFTTAACLSRVLFCDAIFGIIGCTTCENGVGGLLLLLFGRSSVGSGLKQHVAQGFELLPRQHAVLVRIIPTQTLAR
jgi:hypothetical protein